MDSSSDETPSLAYTERLSIEDREEYEELKRLFAEPSTKSKRNTAVDSFRESLERIRKYIYKDDHNKVAREHVCGICWFNDRTIGVNVRRLGALVSKRKSSINGLLEKLHLATCPGASDDGQRVERFLALAGGRGPLRQWTVRKYKIATEPPKPEPDMPPRVGSVPVEKDDGASDHGKSELFPLSQDASRCAVETGPKFEQGRKTEEAFVLHCSCCWAGINEGDTDFDSFGFA